MAVLDKDDNIESWITVKGNHIPIMKGQSKEDAVKSFLASKSDKELAKRSNKPEHISEATKRVEQTVKGEKKSQAGETNGDIEQEFGKSAWTTYKDFASLSGDDYRIEIFKEPYSGGYRVSTIEIDSDDEEDSELFDTLAEAKEYAMQQKEEYIDGLYDSEKLKKVENLRKIVRGSMRFEKSGKSFMLMSYYGGDKVYLDFEKLTGKSASNSVRYSFNDGKLHIEDYYGKWEKDIDFSELSDEEIADMIKR